MKITKDFTKGQIVIVASNYDDKGTWEWRRARVVSCGMKQMTLESLEGEMLGRNYPPRFEVNYQFANQKPGINNTIVMADRNDEEAAALVKSWADYTIEWETYRLNKCLEGNHGENYDRSIQKDLKSLLAEGRVLTYEEARAESKAYAQAHFYTLKS
ncbi:MAG: hypothetical protein ACRCTP_04070 [Aeromonas popoffii]|uniref:hypothetical protein n=1 Tax=Aeromonas popoffii TaxID=70856 RepID=UPI003F377971